MNTGVVFWRCWAAQGKPPYACCVNSFKEASLLDKALDFLTVPIFKGLEWKIKWNFTYLRVSGACQEFCEEWKFCWNGPVLLYNFVVKFISYFKEKF